MSLQPSISGRAETDLTNQYRWYLDKAGVEVAERYLVAFDDTVARIARTPGIGRLRRFRSPTLAGIRSLVMGGSFGAHLVFFRHEGQEMNIERVLPGARDLEQRLLEPPEHYPTS